MRLLIIVLFSIGLYIRCEAALDDTLPRGIDSRFLVFPFLIKSPETDWGFGVAAAYFFKASKTEEELRTSDVNLISLYTLRKQTVIVLGSTIFFPGEKKVFRFQG